MSSSSSSSSSPMPMLPPEMVCQVAIGLMDQRQLELRAMVSQRTQRHKQQHAEHPRGDHCLVRRPLALTRPRTHAGITNLATQSLGDAQSLIIAEGCTRYPLDHHPVWDEFSVSLDSCPSSTPPAPTPFSSSPRLARARLSFHLSQQPRRRLLF